MRRSIIQLESLMAESTAFQQFIPPHLTDGLDHVELLLPEGVRPGSRDLLEYALAYVEHYRGNVPQLEPERELLFAALRVAWQQEKYSIVVRLVAGLAYLAGRLKPGQAEYILYLGIEASRAIRDKKYLTMFLNRLGGLLFAHSKYQQGQRIWRISLRFASFTGAFPGFWEPLASFVYISDLLGSYEEGRELAWSLPRRCQIDDPASFAVALFIRGFFARWRGDEDRAYSDLCDCLRWCSCQQSAVYQPFYHQLFQLVVQTELARLQGHYLRSQEHTGALIALAALCCDNYTTADLIIDQFSYACEQQQMADARALLQQLHDLAQKTDDPNIYWRSRFFEQRFNHITLKHDPPVINSQQLALPAPSSQELSRREREVLQLVAEGLSNREIARRLVVTPGTVKKHLEHIYTRLNVHSRTAAIASIRDRQQLA